MNAKQSVPLPVFVVAIVLVLGVAGFIGFRAIAPERPQAPSAPEMYSKVRQMALQSGGDYTKLSPNDQKYLEVMSHGHGQKLLANELARANASGGK